MEVENRINKEKLGILVIRYLLATVWLSQGFAKIFLRKDNTENGNFHGFLGDLISMKDTNPIPFVVNILDNFLIPNYKIIVVIVILTELSIGFSLLLGLFTRLGATIGGLMTISLWILTLGWGEWIFTYPLIFFPHVLFFLSESGYYFGLDKIINGSKSNKILNILM